MVPIGAKCPITHFESGAFNRALPTLRCMSATWLSLIASQALHRDSGQPVN
jgi:hypothetical protein